MMRMSPARRSSDRETVRVAVDARCLNVDYVRGMGKCLLELIRHTATSEDVEWHLLSNRPDLPIHTAKAEHLHVSVFEVKGHRFHSWEQIALPWRARGLHADILHGPAMRIPRWQPIPTIVTLHDTMPWQMSAPDWPDGYYRRRLLPAAFASARAIITVSESSRRDIISRWPGLVDKLHVIPNGVGEEYLAAQPNNQSDLLERLGVVPPFLMYVGGDLERKRLDWALDVWLNMGNECPPLVVCGVDPANHDRVRSRVPPPLRARLVLAPFIQEADLPELYIRAAAVLYPTRYEGFGLPALESQAVGTPVLFSDVPGLNELKGPGAHVVPLEDRAAWTTALSNLLRERGATPRPDESARRWARGFSWDVYAKRTIAVYRDCLS